MPGVPFSEGEAWEGGIGVGRACVGFKDTDEMSRAAHTVGLVFRRQWIWTGDRHPEGRGLGDLKWQCGHLEVKSGEAGLAYRGNISGHCTEKGSCPEDGWDQRGLEEGGKHKRLIEV